MKFGSNSMSRLKFALPTNSKSCLKIRPEALAFDIDGVVADTMEIFVDLVRNKLGLKNFSKDSIIEYELYRCVPAPRDAIDELLCITLSDEYTMKIPPLPGAKEFLSKLGQVTNLRFVTARIWPESIIKWLYNLLPEVKQERIEVFATGDPQAKANILKNLGVSVFVEDRLDTCHSLREEGFQVVLFDQPWNRKENSFIRIKHWDELNNFIDWDSC